MANLTKSNFNEKIVITLQEQRIEQFRTGEPKSVQEFPKKKQYFKENWMPIIKPQQAGIRDLNKQEKCIQY